MRNLEATCSVRLSNLYAAMIAIGLAIMGLAGLYLSYDGGLWQEDSTWRLLIRHVGSLLIVSTVLSFVWQLFGKRAFMGEILARANLAPDVEDTGIRQICMSSTDVAWLQLFEQTDNLDLTFAYATSWRGQYRFQLEELLKRKGSRIRLILPDPENDVLMKSISTSWQLDPNVLVSRIVETKDAFLRLAEIAKDHESSCKVWYTACHPVLSMYRFDHYAVVNLYAYVKSQRVPHFTAVKSGSLYEYVAEQFDRLITDSGKMVRRVP